MKNHLFSSAFTTGLATIATLVGICLYGQTVNANQEEIDRLQQQLDSLRKEMHEALKTYQDQIEKLESKLRNLEGTTTNTNLPSATTITNDFKSTSLSPPNTIAPLETASTSTLRYQGSGGYASLSLDVLTVAGWSTADDVEHLNHGAHDPKRKGFTLQSAELAVEGAVDPFFRGSANFAGHSDEEGEFHTEWEEAYVETLSLPAGLQLKAGKFLTEFGRLNATHPHSWDFVDTPLVLARILGPHGLNTAGLRISWLLPIPFYSELCLTIQDSRGHGAFSFLGESESPFFLGRPRIDRDLRGPGDLLFVPRYALSLDLSQTHTIMLGASAALGPNNAGPDTRTEIYGMDFMWKWKSATHHGGFPFITLKSEVLFRHAGAGWFSNDLNQNGTLDPEEPDVFSDGLAHTLPSENIEDWGLYTELAWGFKKGWIVSLRWDYTSPVGTSQYEKLLGTDPERAKRWRLSPCLSWYPSEFSRLRIQYNYDDRRIGDSDHSVWVQLEFLLGEHGAHKF